MSLLASIEQALADGLGLPAAAGAPALGVFLAYAGAAGLFWLTAYRLRSGAPAGPSAAGRCGGLIAVRPARADGPVWLLAGAVLLALGLDSLLHGDRLFVLWMRDLASRQGWYGSRRILQVAALGAGAVLAAVAGRPAMRQLRACASGAPAGLWTGLCALTMLHAVRWVSLHHTDLLLDFRLAGASVGRWIELLSLVLAAGAALSRMRPPTPQPLKEFPHV